MPWSVDNPPAVAQNWTDAEKRKCIEAANAVLQDGGSDEDAIFACIHAAGKSAELVGAKAIMKSESDGDHPASHYLVVEDPEKPSTWHLRVRDVNGDLNHTLMGAAWAACHEDYRGNRYEGPGKEEAIRKLRRLYAQEKLPTPDKGNDMASIELKFGLPVKIDDMKLSGDEWRVDGYASTFGDKDLGDDIVVAGAFDRTLARGHKIRFLHSHRMEMVLGLPKSLTADTKGLLGQFKISRTRLGEETRVLLQDGALDSFSIGYVPKKFDFIEDGQVRQLKDVELLEVSVVALPMNPNAIVTNVKDYLAALGLDSSGTMTMAQRAKAMADAMAEFLCDTRGMIESIDRPLSITKRQELEALLEQCSRLDAVRSDLTQVLGTAPHPPLSLVNARKLHLEIAERKRRLAHILS